ncbi:MAG: hypothetical protein HOQ11_02105 [Gemmatimonadaceae bacterium]|nr:hypothetical protein [Gemmatimonadaceae bacterium]NUQ92083.1 hypothetical protein [Gemmatimonadaceae bacterium]NUR33987.1 hypothetical protein [Gemmatimonadaceae bacterium]NUS96181.1 hypothetical protein [Gemmatimonadaceae bacterium]
MNRGHGFLLFSLFTLFACAGEGGGANGARLIDVEQQLTRTLGNNKGVKVSLPTPDTLLVHVPIGRDIIRNGPQARTNLDSASRVIARSALATADPKATAQLAVVVELSRSRQIGPFVWSEGSTRTVYTSSELRAAGAQTPATVIP